MLFESKLKEKHKKNIKKNENTERKKYILTKMTKLKEKQKNK